MKKTIKSIAIAACSVELTTSVPSEIMLTPAGEFKARDGRPFGVGFWKLDAESATRVIAKAEAAVGDFVIDYEHQTLNAEENGQPAPAAGWFKKLEWREDDGLYAVDVRWTDRARALIEAGEYRYISPVLEFNKNTGVVLGVPMAALTNYPALDGNSDLVARAAAKFQTNINEEDNIVNREQLIAMLELGKDASDEQIDQAMTALKAKAASTDQKDIEIATLKAEGGQPDPAKFVPIATFESLKADVATLKTAQDSGTVAALVKQGVADGKLLPVQEEWATELGISSIDALKGYLEKTPAIAALKGSQSKGKDPAKDGDGNDEELTEDELAVCKNLGISAEEYKKVVAA